MICLLYTVRLLQHGALGENAEGITSKVNFEVSKVNLAKIPPDLEN
jgi:hypothetical protein